MRVMVAAVLAVLLAGGVASAQLQSPEPRPTTVVKDPARDTAGPLDVGRVALVRGTKGRLRAEITMRRAWGTADLRGAQQGSGSVCLRVWTDRDPSSEPANWLVCATPPKTGDALVGRVLRERVDGVPAAVTDAKVTRPTERTVYLQFPHASIGTPEAVRFSVETITRAAGCPRTLGCRDLGPDALRTAFMSLPRS
jgi:hypothetical protein